MRLPALSKSNSAICALLVFSVLAIADCENSGGNRDGSKYREIQQLWSGIPLYPGTVEVSQGWKSQPSNAYLSKSFKCTVSYDDLKSFHIEKLTKEGWEFLGEKPITRWFQDKGGHELDFRKGDYVLNLEYAGEKAHYGWDYGITVAWEPE